MLRGVDGPIACGALQPLFLDANEIEQTGEIKQMGEIKRMYVVPEHRGEGLSRLVLSAIEQRARDRGMGVLRLETALAFTAAVALYRSCGYVEIPAWGTYVGDPSSYCMERVL